MIESDNSLGERAWNQNELSVGVIRAFENEYEVVKRNLVEQFRETLHVATQGSNLFGKMALLLVYPLTELLEISVRRLGGSELLDSWNVKIVCRDAFGGYRQIDYRGRNIN